MITLPQDEDAEKPFRMEVEVDRGLATYPYPLPEKSADEFLDDERKGWGELQNNNSSPAYAEVTATPVCKRNSQEPRRNIRFGKMG